MTAATAYQCVVCPFSTSHEDARRGHETYLASNPRGWLGHGESHAMYSTAVTDAFASYGDDVDARSVPALVLAGVDVWSYGYGDEDGVYTVIDAGDLALWSDADVVASWAPFRAAPADIARVLR